MGKVKDSYMKKIGILVKKEIMEILRDKKTLIIMVVVPVLLYPLIIIAMTVGMSMMMQAQEEKTYTIGYRSQDQEYVLPLEEIYGKNQDVLKQWEVNLFVLKIEQIKI